MNTELFFEFSKNNFENINNLVNYNIASNYKDTLKFVFEENEKDDYIIMDSYCINPDCGCTDIFLNLVERKDGKITKKIISIEYDYKVRKIIESHDDLSVDLENDIVSNDEIHEEFKNRHALIKKAFKQQLIERPSYNSHYLKIKTSINL